MREIPIKIPNEALLHPALPGAPMVQCLIKRHRSGLGLYPIYRMYLIRRRQGPLQRDGPTKKPEERGEIFLLAARRRSGVVSGGHSFLISRHPTDLEHGPNHVGKLRSNLLGSQWMLYDCGASPAKLAKGKATGSERRELAHIWSEQNIVGREGPRRTRITLPPLDEKAAHLQPEGLAPSSREESLSRGFRQHKKREADAAEATALAASSGFRVESCAASESPHRELFFFDSIEPEVDPFSGRHALDFQGRALCASVKNFQLESREEPGVVRFLFGKHAKNEYCVDYSYPMSPLQAFAVALSALGYKLCNEGG